MIYKRKKKTAMKKCKIAFLVCTAFETDGIQCRKEVQIIHVFQGIFSHISISYHQLFSWNLEVQMLEKSIWKKISDKMIKQF